MNIDSTMVQKLREATGLGMMVCKKALVETDGDMEKAIEHLRKQGQATAAKRAGKVANEGKISIVSDSTHTIMYEVNSETDFVARNTDFLTFSEKLGKILLEKKPHTLQEALSLPSALFNGQSVENQLMDIVGKIGEKINFRRFLSVSYDASKQRTFSYVHGNGKIGVIVLAGTTNGQQLDAKLFTELGKDIAMQVAASKPISVNRDSIPESILVKEKEIYRAQAATSGKPEKIWDKIIEGKLVKYYQQSVLLEQEFIKDTDKTVTQRIQEVEKAIQATITIESFFRYELGAEE